MNIQYSMPTELPNQVLISAATGEQLWTSGKCRCSRTSSDQPGPCPMGGGNRMVYIKYDNELHAFDTQDDSFKKLWSLKMPNKNDRVFFLDGYIIAGSEKGEIYSLTVE